MESREGIVSKKKVFAKDNYLPYWTAFHEYVSGQSVSFKLRKPQSQHWTTVSIGTSEFTIEILTNSKGKCLEVQLLCHGDNSDLNFEQLRTNYERDSKRILSLGIQWIEKANKCHQVSLVFENKDPLDKNDWNNQHYVLSHWTEKFYTYFKDKVKGI